MAFFNIPFFRSKKEDVEYSYTVGTTAIASGDYALADKMLRRAAAGGHISACYNLALVSGGGLISPYCPDDAIEFFYKAAAAGHPRAQAQQKFLDAADRGGFGTQNLAQFAAASVPTGEGLNAVVMMCAFRFFEVLCTQYGATSDVIAYELDAASHSDEPAVLKFIERTGIKPSFYEGGMKRLISGSSADQVTDGLNEFFFGMRSSGETTENCLMARCTIVGQIIRKSPFGSRSQPLLGLNEFYA